MTEQPIVRARGEAFREVPPELAAFAVTASVRDRDKDAVLDRLTERAGALRAVLDAYGQLIERREAGALQIYPDFKRSSVSFVGETQTTVTVADFAALGEMLIRLAGLEQVAVAGPWWSLRPGSRAGAEVRRLAVEDALARAHEYAAAVGARVDRLLEISDEVAGGGVMPAMRAMGAPDRDLAIDPQQQTVHASVIVRVTITEPDLGGSP